MAKKTKEEREAEFIEAIEQVLGFSVLPWQRRLILDIRAASLAGKAIKLTPTFIQKMRKF